MNMSSLDPIYCKCEKPVRRRFGRACTKCGRIIPMFQVGIPEPVRPFSCGSEYGDWKMNNCERCAKFTEKPTCELESELALAYFGTGTLSKEISDRLGVRTDTYKWFCKELVRR
jgi:RNA polymerase subunit RPABC4/transcription elongation factor Spt4